MGGSQSRGEREVTVEQREDGGQPRIVVSWNAARPKTSDDPSHLTVNAFNSYIFSTLLVRTGPPPHVHLLGRMRDAR